MINLRPEIAAAFLQGIRGADGIRLHRELVNNSCLFAVSLVMDEALGDTGRHHAPSFAWGLQIGWSLACRQFEVDALEAQGKL